MKYFGIKPPPDEDGKTLPIWWFGIDKHESWRRFLCERPHETLLAEAIRAYEAIGYRCVELDVQETKPCQEPTNDAAG